jgi:predicted branched-subunit amino acid permease
MTSNTIDKATRQEVPAWVSGATAASAFARGLALAVTTPGIVLFLTALGFGTLVRDAGLHVGHALMLSVAMYALPAQVMVVDQIQRGATLATIALAVTLTAVRLLPMTVSLLPYLRSARAPVPLQVLAVHAIAITAWSEGHRRLPQLPEALRLPHFLGLALGMMAATSLGAVTGFLMAAQMPPVVQTALLFLTPAYFLLSTILSAQHRRDWSAIVLGGALAPLAHLVVPGLDLLIAGLVGGTVAYLAGRAAA